MHARFHSSSKTAGARRLPQGTWKLAAPPGAASPSVADQSGVERSVTPRREETRSERDAGAEPISRGRSFYRGAGQCTPHQVDSRQNSRSLQLENKP